MNRLIPALLILVLVLVGVFCLSNYNALLNSDGFTYLSWARRLVQGEFGGDPGIYDLLKDYWPSGRVSLESGNRHLDHGYIFVGMDPGYPLLLALVIGLFGFSSVFFLNPVLGIIAILAAFLFYRRSFVSSGYSGGITALAGILLFLLIPPGRVLLSTVKVMRDIPPLSFLICSYLLLCSFVQGTRRSWLKLLGAFLLLGFAVLIRYNYLLYILPALAYIWPYGSTAKKKLWMLLWVALFFSVTLGVVMLKDSLVHRDCWDSCRIVSAYFTDPDSTGEVFTLDNISRSGGWYLEVLTRVYSIPLLFFGLLGIFLARRRPELILLVGTLLINLLLGAIFRYRHTRYLLPFYFSISGLIAFGIMQGMARIRVHLRHLPVKLGAVAVILGASLVSWLFWPQMLVARLILGAVLVGALFFIISPELRAFRLHGGLLAGLLVALLAAEVLPQSVYPRHFTLADARHLGKQINQKTSPGSLVICARYLKQNIEMYSHCFSLNLNQISTPFSLKPEEAVRILIERGVDIYGLDNKGRRKAKRFLDYLGEYFSLEPLARWRSKDLNVHYAFFSENEFIRLYQVSPWEKRKASFKLPGNGERMALVDMRHAWWDPDRERIRARCSSGPLSGNLKNLYNYLLLPAFGGQVTIFSDQGLPDPVVRLWSPVDEGLTLAVGSGLEDWKWLSKEFFQGDSGARRIFSGRGSIRVPQFPGPSWKARLRLRSLAGELRLKVSVAGKNLGQFNLISSDWNDIEVELPEGEQAFGTGFLELEAFDFKGKEGAVELDRMSLVREANR